MEQYNSVNWPPSPLQEVQAKDGCFVVAGVLFLSWSLIRPHHKGGATSPGSSFGVSLHYRLRFELAAGRGHSRQMCPLRGRHTQLPSFSPFRFLFLTPGDPVSVCRRVVSVTGDTSPVTAFHSPPSQIIMGGGKLMPLFPWHTATQPYHEVSLVALGFRCRRVGSVKASPGLESDRDAYLLFTRCTL